MRKNCHGEKRQQIMTVKNLSKNSEHFLKKKKHSQRQATLTKLQTFQHCTAMRAQSVQRQIHLSFYITWDI